MKPTYEKYEDWCEEHSEEDLPTFEEWKQGWEEEAAARAECLWEERND